MVYVVDFALFSVQAGVFDKFTAKFWFGCKFKWTINGLDYVGGEGCTIEIDANLISWFDLDDLVVSKVGVEYEHSLFFMNPACMQFEVGLKSVNSDESVMKMTRLGVKFMIVAVYIYLRYVMMQSWKGN